MEIWQEVIHLSKEIESDNLGFPPYNRSKTARETAQNRSNSSWNLFTEKKQT